MTIAKGRSNFECYLDESFIILERYLDLLPDLITEYKNTQLKETEKTISKEEDPYIKQTISTHLHNLNRFEDFNEMHDIFYKSYLISICSFSESFLAKLFKKLSILNEIKKINDSEFYFKKYLEVINNYLNQKNTNYQIKLHNIFELRNLIVHGNSLLVNPNNNNKISNRILIVNQFVESYPNSLKIDNDNKLIIKDNIFLTEITSIIYDGLSIILSQTETKLKNSNLHIVL